VQFEKSVTLDPKLPLAYAGLGDGYGLIGLYDVRPVKEVIPKAKEAALKAIQLGQARWRKRTRRSLGSREF